MMIQKVCNEKKYGVRNILTDKKSQKGYFEGDSYARNICITPYEKL